jgi:hypothetical protein
MFVILEAQDPSKGAHLPDVLGLHEPEQWPLAGGEQLLNARGLFHRLARWSRAANLADARSHAEREQDQGVLAELNLFDAEPSAGFYVLPSGHVLLVS